MHIYRLETIGSLDGLVTREEAPPVPSAGEVLVRVKASALNFRDRAILLGKSPFPVRPGVVPISDAAGEVEEVGPGVSTLKVGDRVVSRFLPTWYGGPRTPNPDMYGSDRDGWLTEYKVVRAEALSLAPSSLTLEEAASLPCAAVTGWSALAGVRAGDTVLTQGSGGVSLFALQLAKALGARVLTTTTNPKKATRLRELGADEVIEVGDSPEWSDQVRALTGGRGVDRIVEVGGPGTLAQSTKAVAYGGPVSMGGALAAAEGGMDFWSVFMSQARFQPIATGSRRDLEDLCRLVEQHQIRPVIDSVYSFEDAKAGWSHYAGRKVTGKVVFRH